MRLANPASVRRLACAALMLPGPAWAVEVMVAPSDLAKFAPSDSYRLTDPLPVAIPLSSIVDTLCRRSDRFISET